MEVHLGVLGLTFLSFQAWECAYVLGHFLKFFFFFHNPTLVVSPRQGCDSLDQFEMNALEIYKVTQKHVLKIVMMFFLHCGSENNE
jgi:hypothetical protein